METIVNRIQQLIDSERISTASLEKQIGASRGVLSRAFKQGTDIQAKWLQEIHNAYPQYSAEWLLTGKGEMLINNTKGIPPQDFDKPSGQALVSSAIPLFDIDAAAGLNTLFANGGDKLGYLSIPNMPKCDGAVRVSGDSMYPLLKSGDLIAYRVVNDIASINYGEIYIVQFENDGDTSIVVKYLKRSELGNEFIKLVSYNKEHDPKDIPIDWITAVARVTFTVRRFTMI